MNIVSFLFFSRFFLGAKTENVITQVHSFGCS
jgi:hypothetical protein